jgi:Pyruvate/2-oxoacid:ferredoxin oxidoreductase delta subunit
MEKWKSLYIYFISGTGNAKASSEWIAEESEIRGLKTRIQQIDRFRNIVFPSPAEKPLIGFAFPTHGFNAAPIMLRFLAGFPRGTGKEVFLLNTRAGMKLYRLFLPGMSGLALLLPAFILFLKGYKVIGFRPVDLPSNWISIHPGIKKKVIESIFKHCEPIVKNFTNKILDGKKVYRGLFSLPVDLIVSPLALAYYVGGRFFLSKTFIANYKCNNCGLCIRECPTASIRLVENRPYWNLTCESCMKCLNHCPEKAIETAHGMAVLFWFSYSIISSWFILSLVNLLNIEPDVWWWKFTAEIMSIVIMILTATAGYRIIHYLMGSKPIRYIIRFTSLTALPFWRRYKNFKTEKKKDNSE